MNPKAKVASTILIIDTFFLSFAYGFNSRHVLVVDSNLPPYVAKTDEKLDSERSKEKKDVVSDTGQDTARTKSSQTSTAASGADTKTAPAKDSAKKSSVSAKHGSKKWHGTK